MGKSIKFFLIILMSFILNIYIVNAGYSFDYGGSSGGTTQTSYAGHTVASGKYLTIGVGLKYSLVYMDASTMNIASSYIEVFQNKNYTQFYKKLQQGSECVKGSISNGTYSYDKHSWEVKTSNNKWYFNSSINPNNSFGFVIDSNNVYATLNSNPNTFYEIVANLINKNDYVRTNVLKNSSSSSLSSEYLKQIVNDTSNKYSDEIDILQNYVVIIEPLYGVQTGTTSHETYTLKAFAKEYSEGKIGLQMARQDQMISNFTTSSEHGVIKKSSNSLSGLLDAYDGTGYFVASIAGSNKKCDPKKECCYDASGTYDINKGGTTKNYKCPDGSLNADGKTCDATVISCKQTSDVLCPDGKTKPFEFNYMFLGSEKVTNEYFTSRVTTNYSGINDTFNDKTILQNLINDYNSKNNTNLEIKDIITVDKRIYEIDESNLKEFIDYLNNALKNKKIGYYYNNPTNPLSYYIWHNQYSIKKNGVIKTVKEDRTSIGVNYKTIERYALYPETLTIEPYENSDGGYKFNINRTMPVLKSTDVLKKGNNYYTPAQYQIKYCITTEEIKAQCNDEVTKAECSGTDGTSAVFHESDNLTACTIPKNDSGFTIVEETETSNYCTVACKEDYDLSLPTNKKANSGEYFVLDVNGSIPTSTINAKRTCVTNQVQYTKFSNDLANKEVILLKNYNYWQDWIYIKDHTSITNPSSSVDHPCGCSHQECSGEGENRSCHTVCDGDYTTYYWNINAVSGSETPNGNSYGGNSGSYNRGCKNSDDTSQQTYNTNVVQVRDNAKVTYKKTLDSYQTMMNNYNNCFNWNANVNKVNINVNDNSYKLSVTSLTNDTTTNYTFAPTLTYTYQDEDGKVFPVPYTYKYKSKSGGTHTGNIGLTNFNTEEYERTNQTNYDVSSTGVITNTSYWTKGTSNISKDYTGGTTKTGILEKSSSTMEQRNLYNCTGTTCDSADKTVSSYFYNTAYVKRVETIKYEYYLPTISTTIPKGTLVKEAGDGATKLELETNASPINVNTSAGKYQYSLEVKNLKDELRRNKSSKNPKDTLETDVQNSITKEKAGKYVCYYEVENEIYSPPTGSEGFNFFYRTVDLGDINPQNRTLGYNWSDTKAEKVKEVLAETNTDYQKLTGKTNLTNSITSDKTTDVYSFTLTPTIMKTLREYNREQNSSDSGYSDWTLKCTEYQKNDGTNSINAEDLININENANGYHCSSPLLRCLASKGTNCDASLSFSPSQISSLKSSKNDYSDNNLTTNINKLILKQNTLDKNY